MWGGRGARSLSALLVFTVPLLQVHCEFIGECTNWLEYQGLVSAIPNRWKNILTRQVRKYEQYEHKYKRLLTKLKNRSKIVYSELISNSLTSVDFYNKWCVNILNETNLTLEEYMNCFETLYKITNVTKLRNFQYRLLHKRLKVIHAIFV